MTEIETTYSMMTFVDLIVKALPIIAAIASLAFCYFIWTRTKSTHFLMERIWWVIAGRLHIHNEYLHQRWQNHKDLEQIRFLIGIPFNSTCMAEAALKIAETNRISLDQLSASAKYFDAQNLLLSNPKYTLQKKIFGPLLLSMISIIGSLTFAASSESVLLKIIETNTWILASEGKARLINSPHYIKITDCTDTLPATTNLNTICELIQDNQNAIKNFLNEQRSALALLIAVFTILFLMTSRHLSRAKAANSIMHAYQIGPQRIVIKNTVTDNLSQV